MSNKICQSQMIKKMGSKLNVKTRQYHLGRLAELGNAKQPWLSWFKDKQKEGLLTLSTNVHDDTSKKIHCCYKAEKSQTMRKKDVKYLNTT